MVYIELHSLRYNKEPRPSLTVGASSLRELAGYPAPLIQTALRWPSSHCIDHRTLKCLVSCVSNRVHPWNHTKLTKLGSKRS